MESDFQLIEQHLENARRELEKAKEETGALVFDNKHLAGKNSKFYSNLCEIANYVSLALNKLKKNDKKR